MNLRPPLACLVDQCEAVKGAHHLALAGIDNALRDGRKQGEETERGESLNKYLKYGKNMSASSLPACRSTIPKGNDQATRSPEDWVPRQ